MSTLNWSPAKSTQPVTGVALVIHGLNVRPDRMQPLVDCLNEAGVDCLSLSLHGHGDNYTRLPGLDAGAARLESFRRVTYALWRDETAAAYAIARARADALDVPLLFSGFSLGGLMGCTLAATDAGVRFERMILFAPALAVRPWSRLPLLLRRRPRYVIRSRAPQRVQANPGTPVAAYIAHFDALAAFAAADLRRLRAPALVYVDRADELVSAAGLQRIAARLPGWTLAHVRKSGDARGEPHHLLIGEQAVGADAWRSICARTAAFVAGREPASSPPAVAPSVS